MSDHRGISGYRYPLNFIVELKCSYEARKNICTEDKKVRGQRVSLPDASMGTKTGGGGTIDKNRKGNCSDTSHNGVNKPSGKTHGGEGVFKEGPFNPVIGFGHV
jgi:hypothetical protein